MADKQLRVVFSVNEADLKRFNDLLKQAGINADKLDTELEGIGKTSNSSFDKAAKGINQLVTGVKAFLALEIINQLKSVVVEASKVAAAGEGIRSAFANMGGTTQNVKELSDAIGGTVSNIKLMEFAVKAMQKGLNMDQVKKALVALDLQADATGASFEELAHKAIRGMQDIPKFMAEVEKKTKQFAGTVADTGDSYDRLAAAQNNLKEQFGIFLNSSEANGMRDFFSDIINGISETVAFINNDDGARTKARLGEIQDERIEAEEGLESRSYRVRRKSQEALVRLEEEYNSLIAELAKDNADKIEKERLRAEQVSQDEKDAIVAAEEERAALRLVAWKDQAINEASKKARQETQAARQQEFFAEQSKLLNANAQAGLTQIVPGFSDAFNLDQSDKTQKVKAEEVLEPIVTTSEEAKFNFDSMLVSTLQIVSLFESLGSEKSSTSQFFAKVFKSMGVVLSLIPGAQGFGLASSGLGSLFGAFNSGGLIPGGGPDKDSILIGATPGEFMVNRTSTKKSSLLLDAINAGEMDDSFLKKLQHSPTIINVDQNKVVQAIEAIPQVDFYKNGSTLYEVRREANDRRVSRKQRITL